jgi:hypothetical protein
MRAELAHEDAIHLAPRVLARGLDVRLPGLLVVAQRLGFLRRPVAGLLNLLLREVVVLIDAALNRPAGDLRRRGLLVLLALAVTDQGIAAAGADLGQRRPGQCRLGARERLLARLARDRADAPGMPRPIGISASVVLTGRSANSLPGSLAIAM